MTFEDMKQKSPAFSSEESVKDTDDTTANADKPAFTPKIMRAPTSKEDGDVRRTVARPKVNRMPSGLLDNQRAELKALEGPKAAADAESIMPPLPLKKTRTLDLKLAIGIIVLMVVINAVLNMTLGKNKGEHMESATETSAASSSPSVSVEAAPAAEPPTVYTLPPDDGHPLPSDRAAPDQATTAPATGETPASGSQDLMSIINRY